MPAIRAPTDRKPIPKRRTRSAPPFGHVTSAACERTHRDPTTLRRSLLLGFRPLRPTESVGSFLDAVERAGHAGFDEVVVYWPDGEPGDRFWSDTEVHAEALSRLAKR